MHSASVPALPPARRRPNQIRLGVMENRRWRNMRNTRIGVSADLVLCRRRNEKPEKKSILPVLHYSAPIGERSIVMSVVVVVVVVTFFNHNFVNSAKLQKRVCAYVFVCPGNYTSNLRHIFCACYLWPGLGPPLATQNVLFLGWPHHGRTFSVLSLSSVVLIDSSTGRRSDTLRISGLTDDIVFAIKLRLLDVAGRHAG